MKRISIETVFWISFVGWLVPATLYKYGVIKVASTSISMLILILLFWGIAESAWIVSGCILAIRCFKWIAKRWQR